MSFWNPRDELVNDLSRLFHRTIFFVLFFCPSLSITLWVADKEAASCRRRVSFWKEKMKSKWQLNVSMCVGLCITPSFFLSIFFNRTVFTISVILFVFIIGYYHFQTLIHLEGCCWWWWLMCRLMLHEDLKSCSGGCHFWSVVLDASFTWMLRRTLMSIFAPFSLPMSSRWLNYLTIKRYTHDCWVVHFVLLNTWLD